VILLMDDSEDDAFLFKRAVARLNLPLETRHVSNGQKAIDYLLGHESFSDRTLFPLPHLILVDLKMPVCDGFDFLAWKRNQPELTAIPSIVMTSSTLDRDIRRSYQLGAHSFTTKVSGTDHLMARIAAIQEWWFQQCVTATPT
jgi:CheY-like chemotaxis protein